MLSSLESWHFLVASFLVLRAGTGTTLWLQQSGAATWAPVGRLNYVVLCRTALYRGIATARREAVKT